MALEEQSAVARVLGSIYLSIIFSICLATVGWYLLLLLIDRKTVNRIVIRQVVIAQLAGIGRLGAYLILLNLTGSSKFCRDLKIIFGYFSTLQVYMEIAVVLHLLLIFRYHRKNVERYEVGYYIFAAVVSGLSILQFILARKSGKELLTRCGYLYLSSGTGFQTVTVSYYLMGLFGSILSVIFLIMLFITVAKRHSPSVDAIEGRLKLGSQFSELNHRYNNSVIRRMFFRLLWYPIIPIAVLLAIALSAIFEASGYRISIVVYTIILVSSTLIELGLSYFFFTDPIIKRTLESDREWYNLKVWVSKLFRKRKDEVCDDDDEISENSYNE